MRIPYALRGEQLVDRCEYDIGGRKPGIVCPGCREPLVAKIGEIREPHFAHLPDRGGKCEYRTMLHRVAVRLLARRVEELLRTRTGLHVRWKCLACGQFHTANLLDGILPSAMARQIGPVHPDLSLYGEAAQEQPPRAVIHLGMLASADKVAFYRSQSTVVWLLKRPGDLADAEALRDAAELLAVEVLGIECPQPTPTPSPSSPSRPAPSSAPADTAYSDGCPACGKNLKRRFLYAEWHYPERSTSEDIAIVMLGSYGPTFGPSTFTERELQVAEEHGADTSNHGPTFYEHHAEILRSSHPIGSYSRGCPNCEKVVPD